MLEVFPLEELRVAQQGRQTVRCPLPSLSIALNAESKCCQSRLERGRWFLRHASLSCIVTLELRGYLVSPPVPNCMYSEALGVRLHSWTVAHLQHNEHLLEMRGQENLTTHPLTLSVSHSLTLSEEKQFIWPSPLIIVKGKLLLLFYFEVQCITTDAKIPKIWLLFSSATHQTQHFNEDTHMIFNDFSTSFAHDVLLLKQSNSAAQFSLFMFSACFTQTLPSATQGGKPFFNKLAKYLCHITIFL